jgi:hypothetical protein
MGHHRCSIVTALAFALVCLVASIAWADDKHLKPAPPPKPAPQAPKPAPPKPAAPKPDASKPPKPPPVEVERVRVVHGSRSGGDLFSRLDRDHDGRISREEAAASSEIARYFDEIDTDGDGFISRAELTRWMRSYSRYKPRGTYSPTGLGL